MSWGRIKGNQRYVTVLFPTVSNGIQWHLRIFLLKDESVSLSPGSLSLAVERVVQIVLILLNFCDNLQICPETEELRSVRCLR